MHAVKRTTVVVAVLSVLGGPGCAADPAPSDEGDNADETTPEGPGIGDRIIQTLRERADAIAS